MLKKRDQGKGEEIGEENFLALILKGNTQKDKCETELENYCQSLHNAKLESKQVHEKLKDYCENDGKMKDGKCTGLKEKIEGKCTEFKGKLEEALGKPFTEENCDKYEPQCHFLEGACIDVLKEKCSKLRNQCYGLKRDKVAKEVLLRALKGELKEKNDQCKDKLKEECKKLNGFSKELMQLCLDSDKTCENLKEEAKKKCKSLEKECEEKYDIVYTPPEEPWIPIQPMPDTADKVGLEELYNEAAKLGLLIEGLHPSMEDLLLYLSQKDNGDFDKNECEKQINNCEYLKGLSGDSEYKCSKIDGECKKLEGKLKDRRKTLERRIKESNLFDGKNGDGNAEIISWHKLYSDFYGKRCAQLQSGCFFLSRYNNNLTAACENVQA
ncbi:hypothetical protein PCK1_001265, partial [Pneumocystis canis]